MADRTTRHRRHASPSAADGRDLRGLRRRALRLFEDLDVVTPFTATQLCEQLSTTRRRPIRLVGVAGLHDPLGLWVDTDGADHILFPADVSPLHRDHIVLHELGHMLWDHDAGLHGTDWPRRLVPHLDDALVRRVMGRTGYSERQEREAEMLASVIGERASAHGVVVPDPDTTTARIESALG